MRIHAHHPGDMEQLRQRSRQERNAKQRDRVYLSSRSGTALERPKSALWRLQERAGVGPGWARWPGWQGDAPAYKHAQWDIVYLSRGHETAL